VELFRRDLNYFLLAVKVFQVVMSPSSFVWWRKERKRVVMSIALLMFESPFVKEFHFLRWVRRGV